MKYFFLTNFRKIHFLFLLIFFSYIFPALSEPGVSVFMYHRFGEDKYPSTNVTEKQFLSHINYVLDNKIKILELEEIIMTLNENKKFHEKAIAFSVDDAYSSFYEIAWPVFRKNNIPVTLFVSTDIIDKKTKGYMTWTEIKKFVDEGGSVGQHTSTHLHMPLNNALVIKNDILDSHKSWIKNIGFIPKLFAYPYGETSNEVIKILKEFDISNAFGQHSGVVSSYDNKYYLPRFSLNEKFGEKDRFEFAVNAYSLDVENFLPTNMFLLDDKPSIEFSIIQNLKDNSLDCFSNTDGKWDKQEIINIKKDRVRIKLNNSYLSGRARLNCTVKVDQKWHWFGYQFLVK